MLNINGATSIITNSIITSVGTIRIPNMAQHISIWDIDRVIN